MPANFFWQRSFSSQSKRDLLANAMRFVARQNSRHGRLIAAVNALDVRYGFGIACTIILSLVNFVLKDLQVFAKHVRF